MLRILRLMYVNLKQLCYQKINGFATAFWLQRLSFSTFQKRTPEP